MEIGCEHWSDCGVRGGGCCAISKFGDNPSYNVCLKNCKLNTTNFGKEKKGCGSCASKGLKRLLTGGAKLLKSELGIDACDEATMIDRKNLCESCEHYDFGVCTLCGCFCAAKVKLGLEKCDDGRW